MNVGSTKNVFFQSHGRSTIQFSKTILKTSSLALPSYLKTIVNVTLIAALTSAWMVGQPFQAYAQSCEYWVAPTGNDANPGTSDSPWATLTHASEVVPDANCTVWFKDGLYAGENDLDRRFETPTTFKAANEYMAILESAGTTVDLDGVKNIIIEGFEIRHSGPGAINAVVMVERQEELWVGVRYSA
jgi:hypothetical protein